MVIRHYPERLIEKQLIIIYHTNVSKLESLLYVIGSRTAHKVDEYNLVDIYQHFILYTVCPCYLRIVRHIIKTKINEGTVSTNVAFDWDALQNKKKKLNYLWNRSYHCTYTRTTQAVQCFPIKQKLWRNFYVLPMWNV